MSENWGTADKFTVVLETASLNDTELGDHCREQGLYPEQVDHWRHAAQDANAQPQLTMAEQKDLEKRHQQNQLEIRRLQQELQRKDRALAEAAALLLAAERSRPSGERTGLDGRKGSPRQVAHRLTQEERQQSLDTCNQEDFAGLPPGQIVPILADQGLYVGSERSFHQALHKDGQAHRRGRARPPQETRVVPRLEAKGSNEVWSWDITDLPTSVRRIWLYLYLVVDVWSRKVVAWDGDDREDPNIDADLVSGACLRERISKGRQQPLILHADNGKAMRHPRRWLRGNPCWRQPEVVWINPTPLECNDPKSAKVKKLA